MIKVKFVIVGMEGQLMLGDMLAPTDEPAEALGLLSQALPAYWLKQVAAIDMERSVESPMGMPYWKKCEGIEHLVVSFIRTIRPDILEFHHEFIDPQFLH